MRPVPPSRRARVSPGFTLTELLVVIAIIAIRAGMLSLNMSIGNQPDLKRDVFWMAERSVRK